MTPNRVVTLLAPVFAALAGWLAEWVANNFPGTPHLDKTQLTVVFIAGATYAAGHVAHFVHGGQKDEARRRLAPGPPVTTSSSGGPGQTSSSAAATLAKQGEELPPPPPPLNVKPTPPLGEQA